MRAAMSKLIVGAMVFVAASTIAPSARSAPGLVLEVKQLPAVQASQRRAEWGT